MVYDIDENIIFDSELALGNLYDPYIFNITLKLTLLWKQCTIYYMNIL